jgi:histone H3/H4
LTYTLIAFFLLFFSSSQPTPPLSSLPNSPTYLLVIMPLSLKQFIEALASDKEIKANRIEATKEGVAKLHAFFLLLDTKVTIRDLALNVIMICKIKGRTFITEDVTSELAARGVYTNTSSNKEAEDEEEEDVEKENVLVTELERAFGPILRAMLKKTPRPRMSFRVSKVAFHELLDLYDGGEEDKDIEIVVKHAMLHADAMQRTTITLEDVKEGMKVMRKHEMNLEDEDDEEEAASTAKPTVKRSAAAAAAMPPTKRTRSGSPRRGQ